MKDTLGIFVAGANGRMGKTVIRLVVEDPHTELVGASDNPQSPVQGADAGLNAGMHTLSVTIKPDLERSLQRHKGVIIDFSLPEGTLTNIERAVQYKTPLVIGTTGFKDEQLAAIKQAGQEIPIVLAPNMSLGMNVVFKLVEGAAQKLKEGYDMEVLEMHHKNKKDAPSGTAERLARILCEATGRKYPDDVVYQRKGLVGERGAGEIGVQSLRGGDVVGEHTVYFCGEGERVEIRHVATQRTAFARGALHAAKWVWKKPPHLYSMSDVLEIS